MTLRVTLDANVIISGFAYGGVPGLALEHGVDGHFVMVLADEILAEVERKLLHKLKKTPDFVSRSLAVLREAGTIFPLSERLNICRDPKDNQILECALAGQAEVIVTGDKDLLVLETFRGIHILTPRQFLDELSLSEHPAITIGSDD